jgi:hypothetical protein
MGRSFVREEDIFLDELALASVQTAAGVWLADVGLGDVLHQPLPLHEGTYMQGPFRYQLRRSAVEPGGWRLDHDPAGSFAGKDFCVQPATIDEFTSAKSSEVLGIGSARVQHRNHQPLTPNSQPLRVNAR